MPSDSYIDSSPDTKRPSLANDVANRIVEMIRRNEFEPGTRIPSEFELADEFAVGRGTVREAVKLLVSRNVLEIRRAKGTFVRENPGMSDDPLGLSFAEDKDKMIRDLLELRILLECYAARQSAYNATAEQTARMRELAGAIDAAESDAERTRYDIELHKCIAVSSGNSAISTVLPVIRSNMEHFNRLDFEREWDVVNSSHCAIITAIEQRNPMLAEAEMVKHLSYVTEKMDSIKGRESDESSK